MGLVRMLLWGDDDKAEHEFENTSLDTSDAQEGTWRDADATDELMDIDSAALLQIPDSYDPEQSIRRTLEREAAEARERDALQVRVGNLALALESVLRLLKDKGVITDLDLRRMEQQVDLEDGHADGEFHPDVSPVPSHCPQCEARIPAGKRLCQLCGHRFPAE
jgi:hypothetical protein